MRFLSLLLATLVSAMLYGLSFPPAALRPLAWVALVPLLVALRRASTGVAIFLAWLWTVLAAYAVGDWFPRAVSTYYQQPMAVGLGLFLGVSTFMAAAEYMAFAICYRRLVATSGAALPLVIAAAWVAAEFGRVQFLSGNPWALAGYSQVGMTPLVQIADVTGVYGVTFVLLAVNAALAELWLARRSRGPERSRAIAGLGSAVGVVAMVVGYGFARLAWPPGLPPGAQTVPIAVVQGNLDLGAQWRPEFYGENLEVYLRLTYQALREHKPLVVFWPESAMTFFLDEEPLYRKAIARVILPPRVQLVAGGPREVRSSPPAYYNSAFLLSSDGTIVARYDKQRLLPFAEYFPLEGLDLLRRRFARVREFTPGAATPPLPTPAGTAGVMICNEAMFAQTSAARVRAGASYLVNLANDTWVGDPKFAAIVFDTVALRAVEQRRYLVRASTSGPSGIVDPLGRVTAVTQPDTRAVLTGMVVPAASRTVYSGVGDLFAALCTMTAMVALLMRRHGFEGA